MSSRRHNNKKAHQPATELKVAQVRSGWSVKDLADKVGCSRFAASCAINGTRHLPKVKEKIEGVLYA